MSPQAPAGWFPDPENQQQLRYWDGGRWTAHRAPNPGAAAQQPLQQPAQPVQQAWHQAFPGQQTDQQPGQPPRDLFAPLPPRKSSGMWWKVTIGVIGLFFLLGIIGSLAGEDTKPTASPSSDETTASDTTESAKDDGPSEAEKAEKAAEAAEAKRAAEAAEAKKAAKAAAAKKAVVAVQAGPMLKEFEGNEAAADAKYKGKVLQITGHVAKVDTEFLDDEQYIVMLDGGGDFAFLSVNCNSVSAEQAAKVQADSTVTVRGTFDDGGDLGVEIKDCKVI